MLYIILIHISHFMFLLMIYYLLCRCSVTKLCVWLFGTRQTVASQASLSFTVSRSLLKLMSLNRWCWPTISSSVTPFSSCPQSFPALESFPVSRLFALGGQSIRASSSASVLPMNIQGWLLLGLVSSLAVQRTLKCLLQHHSSKASIIQCSAFFMVQLSHPYMTTGKTIALTIGIFVSKGLFWGADN